ncbi:hypothetical protein [Streptomyces sp. NBC_00258]|uniref:hypothetical protein n=1 Tax=Streptomyces sp. NBC_00258 TaxID=2903642 RepID=UPI002E2C9A8E|nr:hypothetical protein [Streptomyces sp. NBC_00258]
MGDDSGKAQDRVRLGRRLRWIGLSLFFAVVVVAVFSPLPGDGSDPHIGLPTRPQTVISEPSYQLPPASTPESTTATSDAPVPSESAVDPPGPYEPAEPIASPNSAAEIIKAIAYLVGAIGGAAAAVVGQVVSVRATRQVAARDAQP